MEMSIELVKRARPRFLWPLGLVLIASLLVVPLIGFPRPASAAVIASDDFNRADGGLGANWTAIVGWVDVDLVAGGDRERGRADG